VPLSEHLIRGIQSMFLQPILRGNVRGSGNPENKDFDRQQQRCTVGYQNWQNSRYLKEVNVHMLRHSYATHLLEDGVNILSVQKLLGHENIETTMVYLHVCHHRISFHSPLITLSNCRSEVSRCAATSKYG
jgi:integrase